MSTEVAFQSIEEWLSSIHLEQYVGLFEARGFHSVLHCNNVTDEDLIKIGVLLPGHRKRILSAAQKSFSEMMTSEIMEPRPVPKKRNIFFKKSNSGSQIVAARPLDNSEHTSDMSSSPEFELFQGFTPPCIDQSTSFAQTKDLPPIPPRVGSRPPIKFSTALSSFSSGSLVSSKSYCHSEAVLERPLFSDSPPSSSIVPTLPLEKRESFETAITAHEELDPVLPPLPAKRYLIGVKNLKPPPPVPRHTPRVPPRTAPIRSARVTKSNLHAADVTAPRHMETTEIHLEVLQKAKSQSFEEVSHDVEEIPSVPPRTVFHAVTEHQTTSQPTVPPKSIALLSELRALSLDRVEGEDEDDSLVSTPEEMAEKYEFDSLVRDGPKCMNEYLSDDDLNEDEHNYEEVPMNGGGYLTDDSPSILQSSSSFSSSESSSVYSTSGSISSDAPELPHYSPIIKAGWLDKNPPQGSYIYQKRWVKLDNDYLRYYDTDKDMYSKRFIPTSSITRVTNIGDQKFEVITVNRNFVFRAESDAERSRWVKVLHQIIDRRKSGDSERTHFCLHNICNIETVDKSGYLELRGCKPKLYVVVSGDKVFLYKNYDDYKSGIGITSIEMNLGNVKDSDRRSFDLTTPYKTFSFIADTDTEKDDWMEAMLQSIGDALSNTEVAERIWEEKSNRTCADCGDTKPEWASVNLCVVICKKCAGEHRSLGPNISKVRSLKMDRKIWTEELIQLFQQIGNCKANMFWAANVPPSEAIDCESSSRERRRFITAKYKEGKYRRYHLLFGNQEALNKALCAAVETSDVAETLSLLFCGAEVGCFSGDPRYPTPSALAEEAGQRLQKELLAQNRSSEIPRLESTRDTVVKQYYMPPQSITCNGFLYKTASMVRPVTEKRAKEDFSRRWCVLNDGVFSYYESDKNSTPNGELKMREVVCLSVNKRDTHGYERTFEIYTESERLYLFGTDSADTMEEWVKSIAKSFVPRTAEALVDHDFERIGRLQYKDGLNLECAKVGWFALTNSTLFYCIDDTEKEEAIQLRKLQELSIQSDNEVLVLVEGRRTLYIHAERKLDFSGWISTIQRASSSAGDTLTEQQLTEGDIPVIVDKCIDYITQYGLTSEGIYRKSGQNSKTTSLLDSFRKDARSVKLKEGDHQVDDVSNTLKRFFRDIKEGIFSKFYEDWLQTTAINDENQQVQQYQNLLNKLPKVNKLTLQSLINHLYCVQRFSDENQMNTHNLAIVFGPTLFQTDGQDYKAGRVVEDLISRYVVIFDVDEQQLKKRLDEISAIIKLKIAVASTGTQQAGDFICTIYLEEKKADNEQHIKVPASMTAEELTFEILDRRKIIMREKDYWCCFEVNEKEDMERPLHYSEKVLPVLHSLGTDSYMVVKKHISMEAMLIYIASKVNVTKHGMMKFREERILLGLSTSAGFHDRYFILTSNTLRLYKEVRSHKPEKEWPVKNLKVYLGIKKKFRPPTCWGFTIVNEAERAEKQHWYLCCDTQQEMREWFATFICAQNEGNIWPSESSRVKVSRAFQDSRLGSISLIPLRGSASQIRKSVAAFSVDHLAMIRNEDA
ncbi:arf-GAP with Rho-GAP domain, ANK repeat and PH domain-containing protein 1 isoform X2 [Protopterus annectens]|uniref:arf-GAP with Rho-GAP domain, ANK repeat and PH domain-containing protein 1 isoform X2 n=1 Tax=Protopterus annectens TaxID=7888 RepID=UPI001CFB9431|nr:arf-GAP with Rho-GAP domain, ANK repeat and PH domain-containing protein 1 isoform X2 [Protopterus annectens]